jgi:hypothetical protein
MELSRIITDDDIGTSNLLAISSTSSFDEGVGSRRRKNNADSSEDAKSSSNKAVERVRVSWAVVTFFLFFVVFCPPPPAAAPPPSLRTTLVVRLDELERDEGIVVAFVAAAAPLLGGMTTIEKLSQPLPVDNNVWRQQ